MLANVVQKSLKMDSKNRYKEKVADHSVYNLAT